MPVNPGGKAVLVNGGTIDLSGGSAVQLDGGTPVTGLQVTIQALTANSGSVFIGDASVSATGASHTLYELPPGASAEPPINTTKGLYGRQATGGSGCKVLISVIQQDG